jgi:glycerol kinase
MQFQSDLMSTPVIRPKITELTVQGAAYLAGLAIGFWENFEEISTLWKEERRFTPEMAQEQVDLIRSKWANAVRCAQLWESI